MLDRLPMPKIFKDRIVRARQTHAAGKIVDKWLYELERTQSPILGHMEEYVSFLAAPDSEFGTMDEFMDACRLDEMRLLAAIGNSAHIFRIVLCEDTCSAERIPVNSLSTFGMLFAAVDLTKGITHLHMDGTTGYDVDLVHADELAR